MLASSPFPRLALFGLTLACSIAGRSAEPPALKPAALTPQKEVLAYAASHAIAIDGIELANATGEGAPGDTVTALIATRDLKGTRQWLTQFTFAHATREEKAKKPAGIATVNVNGRKFEFDPGVPVALEIRTVGPFSPGQTAPVARDARTPISPGFLGLGIDRACEAMCRMDEIGQKLKKSGSKEEPELSEENARAFAGLFPAMVTYFAGVQNTPGLREILWDLIEKPSLWSVVKRGGKVEPNFNFDGAAVADPAEWGLKDVACYRLSLTISLNGQPAIRCAFFVTSPRPPLLTSAGIVGIVAESPTDPSKRVDIRVRAARRAAPKENKKSQ